MFEFSAMRLHTKVFYFELEVRESRKACTTDRARHAHDVLTAKLKEMQAGLYEILNYEMRLMEARRLSKPVDFDIVFIKYFFGLNWFGIPMTIIETNEPLSTDEFGELEEIIARIDREVAVIFTIDRR